MSGPQQTSDAVAVTVAVAPLLPVHSRTFPAGHVIVGGVVSTTVTLELHWFEFDETSVAEHATDVVPSGKALPDDGVHDGDKVPEIEEKPWIPGAALPRQPRSPAAGRRRYRELYHGR